MKINSNAIFVGVVLICLSLYYLLYAYREPYSVASHPTEAVILSTKVIASPSNRGGWLHDIAHYKKWSVDTGGERVFQLSYVFKIDRQDNHGTDTVITAPATKNIMVLYNPNNPNQNHMQKFESGRIVGWSLLGLGILYIVLFSGVAV